MSQLDEIFAALDCDGDGLLSAAELRPLADSLGFSEGDDNWESHFEALLAEFGCEAAGLNLAGFRQLLESEAALSLRRHTAKGEDWNWSCLIICGWLLKE